MRLPLSAKIFSGAGRDINNRTLGFVGEPRPRRQPDVAGGGFLPLLLTAQIANQQGNVSAGTALAALRFSRAASSRTCR